MFSKVLGLWGVGCFLAKTESTSRLVPIHPDDFELLGMR